jgi:hypothetical protein
VRIIYDSFPARAVVIPSHAEFTGFETISLNSARFITNARLVSAVRIIITDDKILIGADSHSGPMLIFQEKYDKSTLVLAKGKVKESRLKTPTGKSVIFGRDDDCGCGSKLRAWNPYNTMYSTKDPTE